MHAFAHVTGGGIPGNLVRVLPDRCDGVVWRGTWDEPRVFAEIQTRRRRPRRRDGDTSSTSGSACWRSSPATRPSGPLDVVRAEGHDAWIVGEIVDGHGRAHVETR